MQDKLFIPFNKNQTYIMLFLAISLLLLSFYVYLIREKSIFGDIGNSISVIFLILVSFIVIIKIILDLRKKDKGLYFTNENIRIKLDNKDISIPWNDISGIEIKAIRKTSYLLIYLYNAEKYTNWGHSRDKNQRDELSKYFGTPINLDLSQLDLRNTDIYKEIQKYLDLYLSAPNN